MSKPEDKQRLRIDKELLPRKNISFQRAATDLTAHSQLGTRHLLIGSATLWRTRLIAHIGLHRVDAMSVCQPISVMTDRQFHALRRYGAARILNFIGPRNYYWEKPKSGTHHGLGIAWVMGKSPAGLVLNDAVLLVFHGSENLVLQRPEHLEDANMFAFNQGLGSQRWRCPTIRRDKGCVRSRKCDNHSFAVH